ncbi:hypothetical protein LOK49_LG09G01253 [Camellia lanceoleosa]|uniref:Uncharacterized protein n=1 Tax=Camellia lanceoleosa TaxID=1840588 RepID=A0ACC0GGA3_9ERIC|nr:hypothetical protein LOK49_LG09G01253 [Camellia lanceoleosa]
MSTMVLEATGVDMASENTTELGYTPLWETWVPEHWEDLVEDEVSELGDVGGGEAGPRSSWFEFVTSEISKQLATWNLISHKRNLADLKFRPDHQFSSSSTLWFQFVVCDSSLWLVQLLRFSLGTGIRFDSSCINLARFTIRSLSLNSDSDSNLVINHTTTSTIRILALVVFYLAVNQLQLYC